MDVRKGENGMNESEWKAFTEQLGQWVNTAPENTVAEELAIRPCLAGMKIYGKPIFAVADASDPLFETLKQPEVVGAGHYMPSDWLKSAKTVLTFFLPFTEQVIAANAENPDTTADEWLHGRIEGQEALLAFSRLIMDRLSRMGYESVSPVVSGLTFFETRRANWSERHIGFIAGLGSFGMSKSFISNGAGIAGRLGSVITNAPLPITKRPSDDPYYNCIHCGKCARNCPVHAIDPQKPMHEAKSNAICAEYCHDHTLKEFTLPDGQKITRYGCGKCQVNVPCARIVR